MPVELSKDKWPGAVRTITLGATAADGGTCASWLLKMCSAKRAPGAAGYPPAVAPS